MDAYFEANVEHCKGIKSLATHFKKQCTALMAAVLERGKAVQVEHIRLTLG